MSLIQLASITRQDDSSKCVTTSSNKLCQNFWDKYLNCVISVVGGAGTTLTRIQTMSSDTITCTKITKLGSVLTGF